MSHVQAGEFVWQMVWHTAVLEDILADPSAGSGTIGAPLLADARRPKRHLGVCEGGHRRIRLQGEARRTQPAVQRRPHSLGSGRGLVRGSGFGSGFGSAFGSALSRSPEQLG